MNNRVHISDNERLVALFGLAATRQKSNSASCPSDEKLSELIDNTLNSKQRTSLFRHLNQCSKCYQLWLETTDLLLEEKDLIEIVNLDHFRATAS
ncbi:MAG TPA: hypothetical protein ENJ32_00065 [Crenotrichaceae bacterium]|nr:hypothetical protein [Crenotrichaceae bacterium]